MEYFSWKVMNILHCLKKINGTFNLSVGTSLARHATLVKLKANWSINVHSSCIFISSTEVQWVQILNYSYVLAHANKKSACKNGNVPASKTFHTSVVKRHIYCETCFCNISDVKSNRSPYSLSLNHLLGDIQDLHIYHFTSVSYVAWWIVANHVSKASYEYFGSSHKHL